MRYLSVILLLLCAAVAVRAQGPKGKSFGFGFSLGEPTALTLRFWESRTNSWDAAIGSSHLGNPHIHADYLWHFHDAFNSRIVSLYAGVGGIIGFGKKGQYLLVKYKGGKIEERWYGGGSAAVLAAKGALAVNVIPRNTPLDIFLEIDPVIGLSPGFGFDFMVALGIRFYP